MDLYQGCTVPVPEFVSLSILLKPSAPGAAKNSITDPFVLLSPTSTISSEETISVIKDLHRHVSSILAASYAADSSSSISATIIAQDSSLQSGEDAVARFRPTKANGIAVDYKLIRDPNRVSALTPIILSHTARGQKPGTLSNVFCIIISRALTGCSYAHASSFRVADQIESCVGSLVSPGNNSTDTASAILSRLLLSEDNERITNQMEASRRSLPRLSTANFMSPASKKSSRRNSAAENTGPTNGINGDETRSEPVLFQELSSDQSRRKVEELNILSLVETDTSMRCYEKTGQERKANLDLTGGKSRFRRRKDNQKDPDLDGFDYKGPRKQDRTRNAQSASHASENVLLSTKRHQFATVGPSTGDAASSMLQSIQSPPVSQSRRNVKDLGTLSRRNVAARRGKHVFDEETVTSNPVSVENHPKVQINIALNEDLSCSYRLSEISSCTVEGVVQVQVKSNSSSPTPFGMTIHDSSNHIDVLQENKKFATIQPSRKQGGSESRFVITVPPKADNYFPVLKYKCISDLRPVPIRVQTKVKVMAGECRVALQVSANPNNEASMSDLNIIMGVPDGVLGETLRTQPAGGVWNETKRSVIWFVTELGSGERFQLQAKFQVGGNIEVEPSFPVLVRCTCLFAQLSDVLVDVAEIPELMPVDIQMKLARRFRLVHRERS